MTSLLRLWGRFQKLISYQEDKVGVFQVKASSGAFTVAADFSVSLRSCQQVWKGTSCLNHPAVINPFSIGDSENRKCRWMELWCSRGWKEQYTMQDGPTFLSLLPVLWHCDCVWTNIGQIPFSCLETSMIFFFCWQNKIPPWWLFSAYLKLEFSLTSSRKQQINNFFFLLHGNLCCDW